VAKRNGRAIVFVCGDIDLASGQAFRDALFTAQQDVSEVIVDLSDVAFMGSTGINALIGAYRRTPDGGCLRVVGAKSAVRRVLEITGLSELPVLGRQPLTWRQVTYHTCGWRQWMTEETTKGGGPAAEIIEIGSPGKGVGASDGVHYALETEGETTVYGSLEEAMSAAEQLGSIAPQTSDPRA
jgi:anti-anti-sigma factor